MMKPSVFRAASSPLRRRPIQPPSHITPHSFPRLRPKKPNSSRHASTAINVQRVRFRRPPLFSRRRLVMSILYAAPLLILISQLGLKLPSVEFVEEEEEREDQKGVSGLQPISPDDATFIPFTWSKKLEREFYSASDPEWLAYLTFAWDEKGTIEAQRTLVSILQRSLADQPRIKQGLGRVDRKKGRTLLTFQWPYGPPLKYEVYGILITDVEIAWAPKHMTRTEITRYSGIIWPSTAFWASYDCVKFLLLTKWAKMQTALGIETKAGADPFAEAGMRHSQNSNSTKEIAPRIAPLPLVPRQPSRHSKGEPHGGEVESKQTETETPSSNVGPISGRRHEAPEQVPLSDAAKALAVMVMSYQKNMAKNRMKGWEPPRGCCTLSGTVEVVGEDGTATVEVMAAYDLRTRRFVNIFSFVRTFNPRMQYAKGGGYRA